MPADTHADGGAAVMPCNAPPAKPPTATRRPATARVCRHDDTTSPCSTTAATPAAAGTSAASSPSQSHCKPFAITTTGAQPESGGTVGLLEAAIYFLLFAIVAFAGAVSIAYL